MNSSNFEDSFPGTEKDPPSSSVELVGFGPSLRKEGPAAVNVADIAALAQRRRKRRIWLISVLAAIVFIAVVSPVIYRAAKTWRAASLARTAEGQVEKQQLTEAIATVKSAYMMAPNDPEILRAMAMTLSALDAPRSMIYWNWLLDTRSATVRDRREAAESALKLGYYTKAGTIILGLLKENAQSAPDLLLAARYYALNGATGQALTFANQAVASDPTYKPAVIFLANQNLDNAYLHQQGVDSLLKLADGNDIFSLIAIERLSQEPNLKPAEIDHALTRLQSQPITTEPEKIAELVLQIRKNPSDRDRLLTQAVTTHAGASPADLQQFGTWLNANGESNRIFALIPKDQALANKDLFLLELNALEDQKKWNEMSLLLTQSHLPLEKPLVELYLYRTSRELGDAEGADLHWRSAQVAAAHNPRQSLFIANYTEQLGDNDRAASIYEALTRDLMAGRAAYLGLIRIERQKGDTANVRDLLDEMTARWPDDEAIANDDIYYNLLLSTKIPAMYQRAVQLAKADSQSAPHLTDVALAYLRMNGPAHALKVFQYGGSGWQTSTPSTQAVYAATLMANGLPADASRVAAPLNRNSLLPEERALIQNIP